jgi:hypothetical protein
MPKEVDAYSQKANNLLEGLKGYSKNTMTGSDGHCPIPNT